MYTIAKDDHFRFSSFAVAQSKLPSTLVYLIISNMMMMILSVSLCDCSCNDTIPYQSNPWMHKSNSVSTALKRLYSSYSSIGRSMKMEKWWDSLSTEFHPPTMELGLRLDELVVGTRCILNSYRERDQSICSSYHASPSYGHPPSSSYLYVPIVVFVIF